MTRALVERVERAEAAALARDADRRGDAHVEERHGGVLIAVPGRQHISRAIGITLAELDAEDVRLVHSWFADRDLDAQVQLSPWASATTVASLAGAGFTPAWARSAFAGPLGGSVGGDDGPGDVSVRLVTDGDLDQFLTTLLHGLRDEADTVTGPDRRRARHELEDDGVSQWLARRGDEPVGAGIAQGVDGTVFLGPAATLPAHRRRGVQRALLAARLAWAAGTAAAVAVATTAPDSASARTMQRCGLSLVEDQWVVRRAATA